MRRRDRRDPRRVHRLQNSQFLSIDKPESLVVDLRGTASFTHGFIPGSYHLTGGMPARLLRQNVRPEQRIIYLIGESDDPHSLTRDFVEHGFEIAGWFQPDVIREWQIQRGSLATIEELEPDTLAVRMAAWKTIVLDLREPESFRLAHIPEALSLSLANLRASVAGLPQQSSLTVVCENGNRSSFAASLLWNMNYRNVAILRGGFQRYAEAGLRVVRG